MKDSTTCAKYVKLGSLGECSLKEISENICFEMACEGYFHDIHDQWAKCNAMQLIHWNTFEK